MTKVLLKHTNGFYEGSGDEGPPETTNGFYEGSGDEGPPGTSNG